MKLFIINLKTRLQTIYTLWSPFSKSVYKIVKVDYTRKFKSILSKMFC